MNRLNQDLKKGDILIANDTQPVEVTGGFGMSKDTSGSALYARFINGTTGDIRNAKLRRATAEEIAEYKARFPIEVEKRIRETIDYHKRAVKQGNEALKKFLADGTVPN